ncbi:hypothetical protein ACWJUJ_20610, partial [Escherichia coli]
MATHGLNLICAVTDEHTRQIVDFCDNLGQQLKDPDDKSAWVKLIGTVAKLAMRQPFVLFKGLTFQKLCLPGAFRPGDHHN